MCAFLVLLVIQKEKKIFQEFLDEADDKNIHSLRENSTKDYIWTLYEPWDIKGWVKDAE